MSALTRPIRVFTLTARYLPAYKSGGPVRTISNMVDRLEGSVEFLIFCRDRDSGDGASFSSIRVDTWNRVGPAEVFYSTKKSRKIGQLRQEVLRMRPDVVYLNSFLAPFCFRYLLLRWLRLVPRVPVIIAARGEFSAGALAIKARKKRAFIFAAVHCLRLYEGVLWQASSALECTEIQRVLGPGRRYFVAPDLPQRLAAGPPGPPAKPLKRPGEIRLVFLSRLAPKKNLLFLFPLLARLRGQVSLDIIGPPEDEAYTALCRQAAQDVPAHVKIEFKGPVPNERIIETLIPYHLFAFPTLGENFGHVIVEGLLAGNLVAVSDQTPWQDIEAAGAGFVLPLQEELWVRAIQSCLDFDDENFRRHSRAAFEYGARLVTQPPVAENLQLFQTALAHGA